MRTGHSTRVFHWLRGGAFHFPPAPKFFVNEPLTDSAARFRPASHHPVALRRLPIPIEMLNYQDLGARLGASAEAARALTKRLRLPRQRGNDGKTLVAVDLAEIWHKPIPARSPACHRLDTEGYATYLQAKITELEDQIAQLEIAASGHRADFDRERERGHSLMSEVLKFMAAAMSAREAVARLEGEMAALRSRPWWQRLAG